jgi:hypothetical protein
MSALLNLIAKLRDNGALISELEKELAKNRASRAIELELISLHQHKRKLETQLEEIAANELIDICDYRVIPASDYFPISALASILKQFQDLFTTVFDAIKSGPKKMARVSAEIAKESEFGFGYTYSGSLGIKLTIPNTRLIGVAPAVDQCFENVLKLTQARTSEQIVEFSHTLGVASIRKLFAWSDNLQKLDTSAEIKWQKGKQVMNSVVVQPPQLRELCGIIKAKSKEELEKHDLTGTLVGLDTLLRTFHISFPEGEDMKGSLSKDFSNDPHAEIDTIYSAKITKKITTHFSTEEEDCKYELLSLNKRKS